MKIFNRGKQEISEAEAKKHFEDMDTHEKEEVLIEALAGITNGNHWEYIFEGMGYEVVD